ncbi:SprT-like domain-containing protein [Flavobacterium azooxidireducens]|uniref:SprT-like domain-containing protein n=1 Tax=Flavobacterium azooxidireducens TaxID=1871076 RepID=A0ABY4KBX6_9FLAO|nr:SprT-like domain-containing protein [Flavobacterium azooxidireducens]UPQ78074.1 SprT-like domain-containing protein [Flavobacterium azooxidireducens]
MKTSLKLLFLFIATILLFTSCDKDFYEDVELQKNNLESIDVKTITYDEFKRKLKSVENKPTVKMIMNNTNSIRHFARSGDDSEIEIFTDVIKEITSGTYKSYTMYIKTSDTIASKFYNLTLEEKEGNTAAFITKYSPTENWLNDKNQPFEGDIRTFRVIEPGPGGSIKFTHIDENVAGGSSYPFDCDGYVQTSIVLEPYQCGCGPEHWPWQTCECTNSHPGYTPNLYYECIPNNFGNPGTGNPGSGYSPGGSSPGSSQPGEPSNNSLTTIVGVPDMPRVSYLTEPLSLDARQNDYLIDNPAIEDQLGSYIDQNTINDVIDPAAMAFAIDLIDYVRTNFTNQNDALDYVISEIIVAQIDDSELDECTKGILNQLKNAENNCVSQMIRKLNESIPNSSKHTYKTIIKVEAPSLVNGQPAAGTANWQLLNGNPNPYNYIIKINPILVNNGTQLGIASTLLHEIIHVYFLSLIDDCHYKNECEQLEEFPYVWNYYLETCGYNGYSQHMQMATDYVSIVADTLKELFPNEPQQLYDDLGWSGLSETSIFQSLSTSEKVRIEAVNNAENWNVPSYNPSGQVIATPQGLPCE